MAMTGVLRPGFAQIRVLDMAEALVHYRDRIGLDVVSTGEDGRVYLKAYDEFDRHSIVLREADTAGLDVMAFKVVDEATLKELEQKLTNEGMDVSHIPAGEQPGVGRRISFRAPTGHRFDLYAEMELSDKGPMTSNPDVVQEDLRGMKAIRFDHCLLYGGDIDGTKRVFENALGFRMSECVRDENGMLIAIFLTCSTKAHDLALVRHEEDGKLHHVSFLVEDWTALRDAADIMTRYDISVDIGPTRHGITRGQTIYFFDPSGNRNEVFAGGYDYYPDNPLREWKLDEVGKAIFYYERQLNDRFMTVVT
ncbi:catechol 2,3-dioxygenase [Luteithermobacter gelatinilyticus]|uniref:catechol 2,3-dioxygenase n=1 Tax=Luteithermobacter gelatinilyticus TaxID=2582913 RepID=UPI001105A6D7|nr:catechol 2,3-dioxygenase [Luteithermobacter gelatinilyticus]|tara:strand:- start:2359 stop:3282 length:924 start_codon:yes stop_codon:yes gene_type:complete